RSPADQAAVDVLLAEQVARIVGLDRAPVDDARGLGRVGAQVLADGGADGFVGALGIARGRRLARADRPHGFVGDDESLPPRGLEAVECALELAAVDMVRAARLPLLEGLADAE